MRVAVIMVVGVALLVCMVAVVVITVLAVHVPITPTCVIVLVPVVMRWRSRRHKGWSSSCPGTAGRRGCYVRHSCGESSG